MNAPERGDLIWLAFSPQSGREQAGRRPALVISPAAYNATVGLALVCPITSKVKGYPFEVLLPPGCPVQGVVLADQLRSLDWRSRQAERIAAAPIALLEHTLRLIATLTTVGVA